MVSVSGEEVLTDDLFNSLWHLDRTRSSLGVTFYLCSGVNIPLNLAPGTVRVHFSRNLASQAFLFKLTRIRPDYVNIKNHQLSRKINFYITVRFKLILFFLSELSLKESQ